VLGGDQELPALIDGRWRRQSGYVVRMWVLVDRGRERAAAGPRGGVLLQEECHVSTLIFSASHHRLTVTGPCLDRDVRHVTDAVETFARTCPGLVLDMTRVSVVPRGLAEAVVRSCHRLALEGIPVHVLTRPDSAAERMFRAVRDDLSRQQLSA
jgi:hypothetical protein